MNLCHETRYFSMLGFDSSWSDLDPISKETRNSIRNNSKIAIEYFFNMYWPRVEIRREFFMFFENIKRFVVREIYQVAVIR